MSFKVKKIASIRLSVIDVRESRDWYNSFFGIKPIEDLKDFVSLQIGDTTLEITRADLKSPISTGGSVGYWLVDNLDLAISLATQMGGKIHRGPLRVEETQRTIVQIIDPFGNVIGFEAEH